MEIDNVKLIYFSPTHTTRTILEAISVGFRAATRDHIDLTRPDFCGEKVKKPRSLAIVGTPVYSGRVPETMAARMRQIEGNGDYAVVVAVYGNRAYEDALLELRNLAQERGFSVVAAGAFIGEHSFSSGRHEIAVGRPDEGDLRLAERFGASVLDKLRFAGCPDGEVAVPGNYPYRERPEPTGITPVTFAEACVQCGDCIAACPVAAIGLNDGVETDGDSCIRCCACVKGCPSGARRMEDERILRIAEWLSAQCRERKEPEVFL